MGSLKNSQWGTGPRTVLGAWDIWISEAKQWHRTHEGGRSPVGSRCMTAGGEWRGAVYSAGNRFPARSKIGGGVGANK